MPSMTITITDTTQAVQNLYTLAFTSPAPTGYTVVLNDVSASLPGIATLDYLAISASYSNGGNIGYVGGSKTKADGSNQARELAAGDVLQYQKGYSPTISLQSIYLSASANTTKFNVEWQ